MGSRMNNMVNQNCWPGLASYPDPNKSDVQLKFCGRDNESYDLVNLIDNNIFVTLYGKSGTGKTSLLKAGIFPLLREAYYLPLIIRLGVDAKDISFQECILSKIRQTVEEIGNVYEVDLELLDYDIESPEYLWRFFAKNRFHDYNGHVVFPVIVLDQFEEVLRERREDVGVLLRQIYFLMDETHALSDRVINGKPYSYDFNFRFVVSIREDELYRLEDCVDHNYLVNMKHCRYRLRNLSEEGIRDAILIPGGDLFLETEREDIFTTIKEVLDRYRESGGANTLILSLVCSLLFEEAKRTGMSHITLSLVQKFVRKNPIKKFYRDVTKKLSNRERSYIEDNLVDSLGRRDSVPLEDFYQHVRKEVGKILFEDDKRILQTTSSSSGSVRVELIHDILAQYLAPLKGKRKLVRKIRYWIKVLTIVLSFVIVGYSLLLQSHVIEEERAARQKAENKLDILEENNDSIYYCIDSIYNSTIAKKRKVVFWADGIRYDTINPSETQILLWKKQYHDICKHKIEDDAKNFRVPVDMMENEPCLVYLILTSSSLSEKGDKEKQSWIDLYSLMNDEQKYQLYVILYRERYRLAEIEDNYKYITDKNHNGEKVP